MPYRMISRNTMHRVVSAIEHNCQVFFDITPTTSAALSKIGNRLFAMNFAGACAAPDVVPVADYRYIPPVLPASPTDRTAHHYRAVRLLLAAVNVNAVEGSPLLDAIVELDEHLAHRLANMHPAPAFWRDDDSDHP